MPNGQTDYEKWYEALPGWLRGLATPPTPIAKPLQPPARGGIAQPTWEAGQILGRAGLEPFPLTTFPEPTPAELVGQAREAAGVDLNGDEEEEGGPTGYSTWGKAFATLPNKNWEVYKNEFGRFDVRRKQAAAPAPTMPSGFFASYEEALAAAGETGYTPVQQSGGWWGLQAPAGAEFPAAPTDGAPTDAFGRTATWNQRTGAWDYPPNWGQRPVGEPTPISPWQQEQAGLQQQQMVQSQQQFEQQLQWQQQQAQMAQAEQERQYKSQLAGQPISWLQYAAYTGEQPVVQPWMVPLGGEAYPEGLQVGQPIPGFEGQAGEQQIQTFAGLPQLTTPSAQLQARWGPTAQQQFLGYRQARTGARPEETQFRLGSQRAPAGQFGGFSRFR